MNIQLVALLLLQQLVVERQLFQVLLRQLNGLSNLIVTFEVFQLLLHSMKIDFGLAAHPHSQVEYGHLSVMSILTSMLVRVAQLMQLILKLQLV